VKAAPASEPAENLADLLVFMSRIGLTTPLPGMARPTPTRNGGARFLLNGSGNSVEAATETGARSHQRDGLNKANLLRYTNDRF
jgi:hypothetical protein